MCCIENKCVLLSFLHMVSSINSTTAMSEGDGKKMKVVCSWRPSRVTSFMLKIHAVSLPHSLSSRLFPVCIFLIHALCNCITILHSQYLLRLPSDFNTIHLQADANRFSFYMQTNSIKWFVTGSLTDSFMEAAGTPLRELLCDIICMATCANIGEKCNWCDS